jgi:hypothetical protein
MCLLGRCRRLDFSVSEGSFLPRSWGIMLHTRECIEVEQRSFVSVQTWQLHRPFFARAATAFTMCCRVNLVPRNQRKGDRHSLILGLEASFLPSNQSFTRHYLLITYFQGRTARYPRKLSGLILLERLRPSGKDRSQD